MVGRTVTFNWRDLVERAGWTAVQTFAGSILVTGIDDWVTALKIAGGATVIAVCKVVIAQQAGTRASGDAFPGGTT